MAVEDAYELAYREAVRALEHQRSTLAELRSRASLLLAAASISISLLGRDASGATPALVWLVVLCFVLLSLCVLVVVWPHADGIFNADPQRLLGTHLARGDPNPVALSTDLIARISMHHQGNARRLARVSMTFRIAACLLAIQMVLMFIAVTVTV